MRPWFGGAVLLKSGGADGWRGRVLEFVLDRARHARGGVAASAIMEDLEVVEDCVCEFDPGVLTLLVEQLGLHAPSGLLDDGVVERDGGRAVRLTVTDRNRLERVIVVDPLEAV